MSFEEAAVSPTARWVLVLRFLILQVNIVLAKLIYRGAAAIAGGVTIHKVQF